MAKKIMDEGGLVSDDIIIGSGQRHALHSPNAKRFPLRRFPRTIPQADAMKAAGVPINFVIEIYVPDEEIIRRLSGRRMHPASGRIYHVIFNPPEVDERDDITGEPLIQRDDDREENHKKTAGNLSYPDRTIGRILC